jgi:hypothetical protein
VPEERSIWGGGVADADLKVERLDLSGAIAHFTATAA